MNVSEIDIFRMVSIIFSCRPGYILPARPKTVFTLLITKVLGSKSFKYLFVSDCSERWNGIYSSCYSRKKKAMTMWQVHQVAPVRPIRIGYLLYGIWKNLPKMLRITLNWIGQEVAPLFSFLFSRLTPFLPSFYLRLIWFHELLFIHCQCKVHWRA